MKIQITSFLACSFIAVLSLMSHHNGVAEEQNKDRTGAPGSSQPCTHCHSPAGNVNTTSTINVYDADGVAVSEYIPGTNYETFRNKNPGTNMNPLRVKGLGRRAWGRSTFGGGALPP